MTTLTLARKRTSRLWRVATMVVVSAILSSWSSSRFSIPSIGVVVHGFVVVVVDRPSPPSSSRRYRCPSRPTSWALRDSSSSSSSSSWDRLKDAAYGAADVLSGRTFAEERDEKPRRATKMGGGGGVVGGTIATTEKKVRPRGGVVAGGYGDSVESLSLSSSSKKARTRKNGRGVFDTKILLRQYEAMRRESKRRDESVLPESVGGDGFASAKESFYSTADKLLKRTGESSSSNDAKKNTMVPSNLGAVVDGEDAQRLRELQTAVSEFVGEQAALGKDGVDGGGGGRSLLARLRSRSELDRAERRADARARAESRERRLDRAKEVAYGIGDAADAAAKTIAASPGAIADAAGSVRDAVVETPGRVRDAVDDAGRTLEETAAIARVVAEDVAGAPAALRRGASDVRADVADAARRVRDFPDEVRYAVGIKKRPAPPPPPRTNGEIAREVALDAAAGLGRAAWGVAGFAARVGLKGARAALRAATGTEAPPDETSAPSRRRRRPDVTIVTTVADVDEDLDREVTEALRSVDEALAAPKETTKPTPPSPPPVAKKPKDATPSTSFAFPTLKMPSLDDLPFFSSSTPKADDATTTTTTTTTTTAVVEEPPTASSVPFFVDAEEVDEDDPARLFAVVATERTKEDAETRARNMRDDDPTRFAVVAADRTKEEAEARTRKEKEAETERKRQQQEREDQTKQKAKAAAKRAKEEEKKQKQQREFAELKAKQEQEAKLKKEQEERKLSEQKAKQEQETQLKRDQEERKLAEQGARREWETKREDERERKRLDAEKAKVEQKAKRQKEQEEKKAAEQRAKQEQKTRRQNDREERRLAEQKAEQERQVKRQQEQEEQRLAEQRARQEWEAKREEERERNRLAAEKAGAEAEREREEQRRRAEERKKIDALQRSLRETAARRKREEEEERKRRREQERAMAAASIASEESKKTRKRFSRLFDLFRRTASEVEDEMVEGASDLEESLARARAAAARARRDAEEIEAMIEQRKNDASKKRRSE